MRVLVTGGAGFIGHHIVNVFTKAGHQVVVLDNLHPAAHKVRPALPADMFFGDVRDPELVARALSGVDVVLHQAAMVGMGVDLGDLPEYVGCNDLGTAVLLAQMARLGLQRLVLASSMVVYGEGAYTCVFHGPVRPERRRAEDLDAGMFEPTCPTCGAPLAPALVDESAPLEPTSVYAATKVAQEHLSGAWANASDSSVVALRYHNVYGPGMPRDTPYSGVAALWRSALSAGQAPQVFEDGLQQRDFVHVTDIARANLLAAESLFDAAQGLRAFNVASGVVTTVKDVAASLAEAANGKPPEVTGRYRAGDVRHVTASPARIHAELGFTAAVHPGPGIREFAHAPLR